MQARTLEIYAQARHRRARARARPARGTGANMWAHGQRRRASRSATSGAGPEPVPVPADARPGRQRAPPRRRAARRSASTCSGTPSSSASSRTPTTSTATLRQPDGTTPRRRRRLGRRLRRRAQRRARAERHRLPGRALRARVLRRRHRGDRARWCRTSSTSTCGAAASTSSSRCAGKDHWRVDRHPAAGAARPRRSDVRRGVPSLAQRGGCRRSRSRRATGSRPTASITAAPSASATGRCFLLGDAAHIHSPVGAQGMNTGLQDAYNLAWKLALVVAGQADAALLDTLRGRAHAGRRAPAGDDRPRVPAASSPTAGSPALFRTRVVAQDRRVRDEQRARPQLAFRTISQIGIRYPDSPLSHTLRGLPDGAPRAGDRFPWLQLEVRAGRPARGPVPAARRHALQPARDRTARPSRGQPRIRRFAAHACVALTRTTRARSRVSHRGPAFYLLRPDGHVGLAARSWTMWRSGAGSRSAICAQGMPPGPQPAWGPDAPRRNPADVGGRRRTCYRSADWQERGDDSTRHGGSGVDSGRSPGRTGPRDQLHGQPASTSTATAR